MTSDGHRFRVVGLFQFVVFSDPTVAEFEVKVSMTAFAKSSQSTSIGCRLSAILSIVDNRTPPFADSVDEFPFKCIYIGKQKVERSEGTTIFIAKVASNASVSVQTNFNETLESV